MTGPAPSLGDHVVPVPGRTWCGRPVPMVPHVVVGVFDYRGDAVPGECIVVVQDAAVHAHLVATGHPINADHGVTLGLDDITRP